MVLLHSDTLWLHARHANLIGFSDLSDIAPILNIYSPLIISWDSFTFLLKLKTKEK
uniref:Uncharacterized protein n=1 Tax=Setaria italica TaxID=4555 RepID=K3ZYZ0_SETIT